MKIHILNGRMYSFTDVSAVWVESDKPGNELDLNIGEGPRGKFKLQRAHSAVITDTLEKGPRWMDMPAKDKDTLLNIFERWRRPRK